MALDDGVPDSEFPAILWDVGRSNVAVIVRLAGDGVKPTVKVSTTSLVLSVDAAVGVDDDEVFVHNGPPVVAPELPVGPVPLCRDQPPQATLPQDEL